MNAKILILPNGFFIENESSESDWLDVLENPVERGENYSASGWAVHLSNHEEPLSISERTFNTQKIEKYLQDTKSNPEVFSISAQNLINALSGMAGDITFMASGDDKPVMLRDEYGHAAIIMPVVTKNMMGTHGKQIKKECGFCESKLFEHNSVVFCRKCKIIF